MCWNAEVSLNTFAFSTFVLGMIMYNNAYTQYKIPELNNIYMYLLLFSVISMQLVEFFIWRNIDNKYYNHFFTLGVCFVLLLQPFFSIMTTSDSYIRNIVLTGYIFLAVPYFLYQSFRQSKNPNGTLGSTKYVHSIVTKSGHLKWDIVSAEKKSYHRILNWSLWLFFFLFSFVYNGHLIGVLFLVIILGIVVYNYFQDNSIGSMWCWLANSVSIYYAVYLLIYLPFCDNRKIC